MRWLEAFANLCTYYIWVKNIICTQLGGNQLPVRLGVAVCFPGCQVLKGDEIYNTRSPPWTALLWLGCGMAVLVGEAREVSV